MRTPTGSVKLIEQFMIDGLNVMFGNPGTVEQGFLDTAEQTTGFTYITSLQETVAAAMADGYARAVNGPALLQLHSGVGLGNGIGMLYQSLRGHTPLLVVAGEAGVRYDSMDAQMAADLVAMARPVTKYAARVTHPSSLLRVVRRALKIAMTPPQGPVFVALPMDVLDEPNSEPVSRTWIPAAGGAPDRALAARTASMLAAAHRPIILVGDEVAQTGAQRELVRLAELLGAEVWSADSSAVNMPASHPLSRGQVGHMFGTHSRSVVGQADVVLIVGTYVFPEVFPDLDSPFRPGAKVAHVDLAAYEIAKNFPVDIGIVADPKRTLATIAEELEARLTPDQRREATERRAAIEREKVPRDQPDGESTLDAFCAALGRSAGNNLVIFDEALTASPTLVRHLPPDSSGKYFLTRGGSLGVGIPGAIGIKLARPKETVVAFTGDGGAMYTYQALWTAARYGIAAKFVICNNGRYRLLDENIREYWRERLIPPHSSPSSFDLSRPDIKFSELARALGCDGMRVDKPEQAAEAVDRMLAEPGPFVVDLITAQN